MTQFFLCSSTTQQVIQFPCCFLTKTILFSIPREENLQCSCCYFFSSWMAEKPHSCCEAILKSSKPMSETRINCFSVLPNHWLGISHNISGLNRVLCVKTAGGVTRSLLNLVLSRSAVLELQLTQFLISIICHTISFPRPMEFVAYVCLKPHTSGSWCPMGLIELV